MLRTKKVGPIRLAILALITTLFVFIISQTYHHASAQDSLQVWHTWQDSEAELLENAVASYDNAYVELYQFESDEALLAALQAGETPDLIIGPDSWAMELDEIGFSGAVCLMDQCEEDNFSLERNNGFRIAGLCDPEQCPECFGDNPPRWCWGAELSPEAAPDIFQAAFSQPIEETLYPIGFPIFWDSLNIMVNIEWFLEHELALPTTVDEILDLRQSYPDLLYNAVADESIDESIATPEIMALHEASKGDPNPQPSKGALILLWSSQIGELSEEFGPLLLLPFAAYRSAPVVEGIYVNQGTAVLSDAVAFATQLTTPEVQISLFAENGRLPTGGTAWSEVADSDLLQLGQANLLGFIHDLPEIDLPDFIERPPYEPPAFPRTPCGNAATWLFATLTDHHGLTDGELISSEFTARQFERFCERYMPDFGTGPCATQAAAIFAQRYAELQDTEVAEAEARSYLTACRGG